MALNNFDLLSLADRNDQEAEKQHQQRLNGAFNISSSALNLAGGIVGLIYPAIGSIITGAGQAVSLGGSLSHTIDRASRIPRSSHLPTINTRKNG